MEREYAKPLRILYVDDYPMDRALVRDALSVEDGFLLTEAASQAEFETELAGGAFDLVLSDFNILGFEGLQVIDAVAAKSPEVPVVIVTGTGTEEVAVESMKRGAADYVIKTPQHIRRLPKTIRNVLMTNHERHRRVQAEEDLRISEERFNLAAQGSTDGMWYWDISVGEEWWSPRFFQLLGYNEGEIDTSYETFGTLLHADDREDTLETVRAHLEDRTAYDTEMRLQTKSGDYRWFRSRGQAQWDENGVPIRMAGSIQDITARKQAEAETESVARFPEENLSPVLRVTQDGVLHYANKASRLLLEEWNCQIGQTIPPSEQQLIVQSLQDVVVITVEQNVGDRIFSLELTPVTNTDYVNIYGHDITERRRAEKSHRLSEQALAKLHNQLVEAIESLTEAFALYDSDDRLVICNSKYREVYKESADLLTQGARFEDHIRQSAYRGQIADAVGREEEWVRQRVEEHQNPQGTYLQQLGSGRWLQVTEQKTRDGGIVGVRTDITERKLAQEALQESQRHYQTLTEASPVGVFHTDAKGNCLYVNERWCEMTGLTLEKAKNAGWSKMLHPDDRQQISRMWAEAAKSKTSFRSEYRILLPDGEVTWVYGQAVVEKDESGEVVGYVGTITNITERKAAEGQLRQRDAELAHVARVSTMGEMTAELAHELGQPLHAISTYALAMEKFAEAKGSHDEQLIQWTGDIKQQANRAAEIVRKINRFLRKNKVDRAVVEVNQLIHSVAELLAVVAKSHRVPVDFELADSLPPLLVDQILVEQVLLNLMKNGMEAMQDIEPEQRQLTIRSRLSDEQTVEISVIDSGSGLPHDHRDRIFRPFYTTKENGMGMGLAICRSTIEEHGGRLWVEASEDRGTTLSFTLPITDLQAYLDATSTAKAR